MLLKGDFKLFTSLRGSAFLSFPARQMIEKQTRRHRSRSRLYRVSQAKKKKIHPNLQLPHQKDDEDPVDEALEDENAVGEFGGLRDLQVVLCWSCEQSDDQILTGVVGN